MAFKEIAGRSNGPIVKWETVGQSIEGIYRGMRPGKKFPNNPEPSKLADIEIAPGTVVTTGAPTVVANKLVEVGVGSRIRITYLGKARGANGGAEYKDFRIELDDNGVADNGAPAVPSQALNLPANRTNQIDEYALLTSKLIAKDGMDTAKLLLDMLERGYPDLAGRTVALANIIKQRGV